MGSWEEAGAVIGIARAGDLSELTELRRVWRLETDPSVEPGFAARFEAWLRSEGDRRTVFLARVSGKAVGMANILEYRAMPSPGREQRCWGYVANVFVLAAHRNRRIGEALLNAVTAEADARHYYRLVLVPTPRSLSFYRRAGFVEGEDAGGDHHVVVRPLPSRS